jgi:hypothetical protein
VNVKVTKIDKQRVLDLLRRLEFLDDEELAIRQAAHEAIVAEISRLVRNAQLSVYRNGDTIDVVSLA